MRDRDRRPYRRDAEPREIIEGCVVQGKCEGKCKELHYENGKCICLVYYYWKKLRKRGKKKLRRSRKMIYVKREEFLSQERK